MSSRSRRSTGWRRTPRHWASPSAGTWGGKLRELRFDLGGSATRLTYWLAPGRRIVLLTVFRKARMREAAEVERAQAAQAICEASHSPAGSHDIYTRNAKEELR